MSPWIKTISNELDITILVITSQVSGHCVVISNRSWRHQENACEWDTGRCVKIIVFIVLSGFVVSCTKQNNICTLVTNCICTHSSVILVFIPSLKIIPVRTETVRYTSTYIILCTSLQMFYANRDSWARTKVALVFHSPVLNIVWNSQCGFVVIAIISNTRIRKLNNILISNKLFEPVMSV